jgi:hypothetical protein
MSTLIKKGFVIKTSSPAKYSISADGCALAEKLNAVLNDGNISLSSQVPFVITGQSCSSANEIQNDCTSANNVILPLDQSSDFQKVNRAQDMVSLHSTQYMYK